MDPGEGEKTMETISQERVRRVLETYPIRLAVLFGSQAEGTAIQQSDIDIAVAFDEELSPSQRLDKRIELTTELMTNLETDAVDVADLETIRPSVGRSALESGDVLLGDRSTVQAFRRQFEPEQTDADTHDDRMQRFDSILDRLAAKV